MIKKKSKNKIDENFCLKNYRKAWNFFKESTDFIFIALGIFCTFIIIGFAFPVFFQGEIFGMLKNLFLEFEGLGLFETMLKIFINNAMASFFAIVFGIVFGVYPLMSAIVNGYLIGFVSRFAVQEDGILTLWRLVPHGFFELPAIIFSIGIGLRLGFGIFNKKENLRENIFNGLRFFVFVVLPLLVVAAVIEGLLIFYAG